MYKKKTCLGRGVLELVVDPALEELLIRHPDLHLWEAVIYNMCLLYVCYGESIRTREKKNEDGSVLLVGVHPPIHIHTYNIIYAYTYRGGGGAVLAEPVVDQGHILRAAGAPLPEVVGPGGPVQDDACGG